MGTGCSGSGCVPAQAYRQAEHSGRFYRPEWKVEMLDLNRVYQYLGSCRLHKLERDGAHD